MRRLLYRLFVGLSISFFSLLFTLFCCEIVARCFLPPPLLIDINLNIPSDSENYVIPEARVAAPKGSQQAVDQGLSYWGAHGHRYRPNVSATVEFDSVSSRTIEYRTNSLGLLEREIQQKQTPKEKRVLILGDSITAGVGVSQEERFTNILNEKYKDHKESPTFFVNAGISGLNAEESLYHYSELQGKISPDLVIFNLYLNDANNSGLFLSKVAPYPFSESYLASWLLRSSEILKKQLYLTSDTSYQEKLIWREDFKGERSFEPSPWNGSPIMPDMEAMDYAVYQAYLDWGLGWSEVAWRELRQIMRSLKAFTNSNNQKLVIILFPVSYQVYAPFEDYRPNLLFQSACRALGLLCIDLLPELRKRYKQDNQLLFYDQCHYNPLGHIEVSKIIEDELIRLDLLGVIN